MATLTDYLINPEKERQHKRISATITAILMVLLVVIAFLLILNQPKEEFPTEGILISFGTTDPGSGMVEPSPQEVPQEVTTPPPTPTTETEQPVEPVPSDVNTTQVQTKKEQKQEQPVTKPEPPKPVEQPKQEKTKEEAAKYTFSSSGKNDQSTSTSQGDKIGSGNEGDPMGGDRPGLSQGDGAFKLGGNLQGRGWRLFPDEEKIRHNLSASEKLVLNIEVDPAGNVKVLGMARGNEVTDAAIQQMVIREVERAKTNPGQTMSRGTVTFVLKPR